MNSNPRIEKVPTQATPAKAMGGLVAAVLVVAGVLAAPDAWAATLMPSTFKDAGGLLGKDLSSLLKPGATVASGGSLFEALEPAKLHLTYAADLRAFFVGDNSGHRNSFGFAVDDGKPRVLFPDAAGLDSPSLSKPPVLYPGAFADMGTQDAGAQLDFFLIARGQEGGGKMPTFWSNPDENEGDVRAVAFAQASNPYLFVSFEDTLGSGRRDYSDFMVAVYMGEENVNALLGSGGGHGVPAPEPAFVWLIVAGCGVWLHRVRRRGKLVFHGCWGSVTCTVAGISCLGLIPCFVLDSGEWKRHVCLL